MPMGLPPPLARDPSIEYMGTCSSNAIEGALSDAPRTPTTSRLCQPGCRLGRRSNERDTECGAHRDDSMLSYQNPYSNSLRPNFTHAVRLSTSCLLPKVISSTRSQPGMIVENRGLGGQLDAQRETAHFVIHARHGPVGHTTPCQARVVVHPFPDANNSFLRECRRFSSCHQP